MKLSAGFAVAALALMLTGYVTTKAGWIGGKAADQPYTLKTMQVQTAEQLESIMNTTAARCYRAGQGPNWKLAMVYR